MIVTMSPEPSDSMAGDFEQQSIRIQSLSLSRFGSILLAQSRIEALLIKERIDLWHSQGFRPDSIMANLSHKVRVICTARNNPWADYPPKFGAVQGRWMAASHVSTLRRIPVVVACSRALQEQLQQYRVTSRAIPNGVSGEFKVGDDSSRADIRSRLGLSADTRLLISVGALSGRKNPEALLKTVAGLPSSSPTLLVVGTGPLSAACKAIADRAQRRIVLLGELTNVVPLLQAADAFVSWSKAEGLPNAALEAAMCGLPLYMSDIAPHREIAHELSDAAEIFPLNRADNLGSRLMDLKPLTRARAHEIHERTSLSFSARKTAAAYQSLYDEICGTQRP